jgi:alkylation response protein AidB-like acyl-CoA dehydrogenase
VSGPEIDFGTDIHTFRAQLRGWLAANFPTELPSIYDEGGVAAHLRWERHLAAAGLGAVHWPREFGGAGADDRQVAVYDEELMRVGVPERLNRMALGLLGPTLIEFGSPQQRHYYLPRIVACDDLWCQGFSEPEAGSDLARIRSRGTVDGDSLVISGEKIWTSLAVYATWMFGLVRTSGRPGEHQGMTFVLIPLTAAGVVVRPIRQLHGEPGFAQVLLEDVRVPLANVIGEIDRGWAVAMACLGYERGSGLGAHVRFSQDVADLVGLARAHGLAGDEVMRDAISARFVEAEVFRHHIQAQTGAASERRRLASVTKLFWSEMQTRIFETALEVLGPYAELDDDAARGSSSGVQRRYWHARGAQIFAGTSEVQRNLIAERLLGLPKSPKPQPSEVAR